MHVRPATPDDAPRLADLIARLAPPFFIHPDGAGAEAFRASVDAAALARYLQDARYRYWLAEDGVGEGAGRLMGFIAMRDVSHLFHLFVEPDCQGQGLARRLWQVAQEAAVQSGHRGGFTVNASLPAVPVYARFGFVPSGELTEMHGIRFLPMRCDTPGF